MITVSTTLTGEQIGEALAEDVEELAYCLNSLATVLSTDYFVEVADHVAEPEIVGPFLRALAEQIDPKGDADDV